MRFSTQSCLNIETEIVFLFVISNLYDPQMPELQNLFCNVILPHEVFFFVSLLRVVFEEIILKFLLLSIIVPQTPEVDFEVNI